MSEQPVLTLSPESPESELKRLGARIAEREAFIEQQNERIHELEERIQVLETRLAQDSHNSSRPPSSDPPFKKPPPRSRRKPSGRKPGGQPGRRGATPTHWSTPPTTA